jgi:hypothetical protein
MAPPGAREGREGVDPSSTHLRVTRAEMCRRGARPLAPLAGAGDHDAVVVGHHTSLSLRLWGWPLSGVLCRPTTLRRRPYNIIKTSAIENLSEEFRQ